MADTVREQILQAVTNRIAPLSGLDIGRAQRSLGETRDRFVSVWDGSDDQIAEQYTVQTNRMQVAVEIIWAAIDNESVEANAIMGELETLMRGGDRSWGGLAIKTNRVRLTPRYADDGSRYTSVSGIYDIDYRTPIGDPYTVATV